MEKRTLPDFPDYDIYENGDIYSHKSNRYLKKYPTRDGYLANALFDKNNNKKWHTVHHWVALAFIKNPKPNKYFDVHHLDENRTNNHYTNLQWCDKPYNNKQGSHATPVIMCDKETHEPIKTFISIGEAEKETGINHSNIVRQLKGRGKSAGGFFWKYL